MNDTGFPRFPAGATPNILGGQARGSEGNAQLLSAPPNVLDDVQTLRQSVRLQGEVISENRDGTVRVRTDRGDIDVQARDVRPAPERGARVEVEIPPQRADRASSERPENVNVRVVRPAPQQATIEAPRVRKNSTPVEVDVRARTQNATPQTQNTSLANNTAAPPVQGLPPEGSLVRLTPAAPVINAVSTPPEILNQIISTAPQAPVITAFSAIAEPTFLVPNISAAAAPPPAFTAPALQAVAPQNTSQITTPIAVIAPASIPAGQIAGAAQGSLQVAPPTAEAQNIPTLPAPRAQSVDVRINAVSAPDVTLSAPNAQTVGQATIDTPSAAALITQNQNAGAVTGVVTGLGGGELPSVSVFFPQTGQSQQFTLQVPSPDVVVGAKIQVTPQSSGAGRVNAAAVGANALPLAAQVAPQPWPLFEDIQVHLAKTAPRAAMAMSAMTPAPTNPAQFGPVALFFIAAVRGGDITQWMNERGIEALGKGGKGLLGKLSQEGQTLTQSAREAAAQDWRVVNLPLAWEGQIHKVGLHYKHESAPEDADIEGAGGTRFVFDLSLDRMGQVQVDGLFRPVSVDGKRLDIMVRTEEIFSEATRAEMRRVYASALRHTDVGGELSFQNNREQWVTVQSAQREALQVDT
jgi:hypothetical protein